MRPQSTALSVSGNRDCHIDQYSCRICQICVSHVDVFFGYGNHGWEYFSLAPYALNWVDHGSLSGAFQKICFFLEKSGAR